MEAQNGSLEWYRGPRDSSESLRRAIAEEMRYMRVDLAGLSKAEMARRVAELTGESCAQSTIARWETGERLPLTLGYRAYVEISGAASPKSRGAADPRASVNDQIEDLRAQIEQLKREVRGEADLAEVEITPTDLVSVAEAAEAAGVVVQAVYNWIRRGEIYSTRLAKQGKRVSLGQAVAKGAELKARARARTTVDQSTPTLN